MQNFGNEKQFGNVYCSFFRTCLLHLLKMFNSYDEIIIDNIFHDKTNEMESHPYFNTNTINHIQLKELLEDNHKILFNTNSIEFLDSDHRLGEKIDSQFIQFVDILLGASLNVIHNAATNSAKIQLSFKIKQLVDRILSNDNIFAKKNSKYHYFNKQSISYFPKISNKNFEEEIKSYYSVSFDLKNILENSNYFSNTKQTLLKEKAGQISLF